MKIQFLHHVSVLVSDLEAALLFYQGIIGLRPDPTRPDLGYPGAWLQVGAQQIHLMELPMPETGREPGREPGRHGGRDWHAALVVSGLPELESRLVEAGVAYTRSRSGRAALFCRDPDGNAWEFVEHADGASGT